MNRPLVFSLYRKCYKRVVLCEARFSHLYKDRWVEFIPPKVMVARGDRLIDILRRCFNAPYSAANMQLGFNFLKEAADGAFSIEALGQWELIERDSTDGLLHGVALLSAVYDGVTDEEYTPGTLQPKCDVYSSQVTKALETALSVFDCGPGNSVKDLKTAIEAVRGALLYQSDDSVASSYCFTSLVQRSFASEYILNILLFLVLQRKGIQSDLVGRDLLFPLVSVKLQRRYFVSWSSGVVPRDNVRLRDPSNTMMNPLGTKDVFTSLLRRQLDHSTTENCPKLHSLCKEQLIFLLTL